MCAQIFIFIYTFKWYIVKLKIESIVSARLVENQNFCFIGVNIKTYKYLSTHFCASGSFSYAQEQLYKKGLKAYFILTKFLLSMHLSVKISMHVFDQLNNVENGHSVIRNQVFPVNIWVNH
jgi:hypothetical protein